MKKTTMTLFATLMLLSLVSCGSENEPKKPTKETNTTIPKENLTTLLSGKTFHMLLNDSLVTVSYNTDVTSIKSMFKENEFETKIKLEEQKILLPEGDFMLFKEKKEDYLLFENHEKGAKSIPLKFYSDKAKAEDFLIQKINGKKLTDIEAAFVGKTFYIAAKGEDVEEGEDDSVQEYFFKEDGKTLAVSIVLNNTPYIIDMEYKIEDNSLTIIYPDEDEDTHFFGLLAETDTYLMFLSIPLKFYKTYEAAAEALTKD